MLRIALTVVAATALLLCKPAYPAGTGEAQGVESSIYLPQPIPFDAAQGRLTKEGRTTINDVYVIHLIVDGVNYNTLWSVIDEGKMPTLARHFIDDGAAFTHAISTFPSTSTSAYQSFVTGLLTGHAGIPHLQRFDREKRAIIDYLSISGHAEINGDLINLKALANPRAADLDAPSIIFELLEGHPTMSLYSSMRRGATIGLPKRVPLHAAWSTFVSNNTPMVDMLAFDEIMRIYGGPIERVPRFSLVGLYSADTSGHFEGTDSQLVRDVLVQFDLFLKEFLDLLDQRGLRDKTYIIVSADHGMHDTAHLFKFRETAMERGIAVKPANPRSRDYTLYAADRGVSSTHVYTRRPDGSFSPLMNADELRSFPLKSGGSIDLIEFIRGLEPTELVIVRNGETSVMVYDGDGNTARIDCVMLGTSDWCAYEIVAGNDLLRIAGGTARGLIGGRAHSAETWKHATAGERYPDAVIQLGTLFRDGRAGDLFIVTKDDWGFRKVKRATHGSLIDHDMRIAMFMTGPTVPRGRFGAMRTVDVFPLLVQWFGLKVDPANHDGTNPFIAPKPEHPHRQALATLDLRAMRGADRRVLARAVRSIAPRDRRTLAALAAMELRERIQLARRLAEYIAALEAQRDDIGAPQATDPRYVADHLEIARRTRNLTQQRIHAMDTILNVLH